MELRYVLLFALCAAVVCAAKKKVDLDDEEDYENPLSNGFGDDIEWVKWDDAVEVAQDKQKPIFLLIHKTWCHACKSLKLTFKQSSARKAFTALSKYFVMVNTKDDEEPWEDEYKPDGKYIPRVLFLDQSGDLMADVKNPKPEYSQYKYYYASPAEVMMGMKQVLKELKIDAPELKEKKKIKSGSETVEKADSPKAPEGKKAESGGDKAADDKPAEDKKSKDKKEKKEKKAEL